MALGCVVTQSAVNEPTDRTDVMCVLQSAAAPAKAEPEPDGLHLWGTSRNKIRTMRLMFSNPNHRYIKAWSVKPATPYVPLGPAGRANTSCSCSYNRSISS